MAETVSDAALVALATALQRHLAGRARDLGIRWSALMVLEDLAAHGPLTQRQLSGRQAVTPPTMSLLARELRAEGLVDELPDAHDGRRRRLHLTHAGKARLARDRERLAVPLGHVLADLREDEHAALAAALPALLRILG